jgi:type II secretion system protein G
MKRGFTLIELLIVIAIIGILSGIVLAVVSLAREKARDSERLTDMRQIRTALEFYYQDHGYFPCNGDDQSDQYPNPSTLNENFLSPLVQGGYLKSTPYDPTNNNLLHYHYSTLKSTIGGHCGQIAVFGFEREASNTPCPEGSYRPDYPYDTHCHILYPDTAPAGCVDNPHLVTPHISQNDDFGGPNAAQLNAQCLPLFDLEYCDYNQTSC